MKRITILFLLSIVPFLAFQVAAQQEQTGEKPVAKASQEPAKTTTDKDIKEPSTKSVTPDASDKPQTEACGGTTEPLWCGGQKYCVYPGSNCCGAGFCGPGQRCDWIGGRQECRYN